MSRERLPGERVLILRVGAMGDVLHALPAVAALRELRPEIAIDWVVDPRWAPLLINAEGAAPAVSRVHLADTRLWSRAPLSGATRRSVLRLRRELRDDFYSVAVDLQGTLRSAVLGAFARTKTFAGFNDPRERAARWLYRQRLQRKGAHVVEQGAALLGEALGLALEPARRVELPIDAEGERWAAELHGIFPSKRGLALLAPTAGWGAKQWPAANFGALARQLHDRGVTVLVNATRLNEPGVQAVVQASGGCAQTVVCSLAQLIALTRRLALVVGNDSGPVHLAAALGTPLVALYGPTDPARNGPWGPGAIEVLRHADSATSYKRVPRTDPGLAKIGMQEVFEAALRASKGATEDVAARVGPADLGDAGLRE